MCINSIALVTAGCLDIAETRKPKDPDPLNDSGFADAQDEDSAPTNCQDAGPKAITYRRKVTLLGKAVSGKVQNFPWLLTASADPALRAHLACDATDIRVFGAQGAQLPHEVEFYDPTNGTLQLWVRVPSLEANVDRDIFLWYGDTTPLQALPSTQVWAFHHQAVWHLNAEKPPFRDSTSFGRHSSNAQGTSRGIGTRGGFLKMTGDSSFVSFPAGKHWQFTQYQRGTVSLWVQGNSSQSGKTLMRHRPLNTQPTTGWELLVSEGKPRFVHAAEPIASDAAVPKAIDLMAPTPLGETSWQFVAVSFGGGKVKLFVNGGLVASGAYSQLADKLGALLNLGGHPGNPALSFRGALDEVIIYGYPMNESWLATAYRNQSDPMATSTWGPENEMPLDISDGDDVEGG